MFLVLQFYHQGHCEEIQRGRWFSTQERHPEEPSAWVRYQLSKYLFIKVGRVRENMVHVISEKFDIVTADIQAQVRIFIMSSTPFPLF